MFNFFIFFLSAIDCGEPDIPVGGFVTGYSFEVHSEVEYHCEPGHYLEGDNIRVCSREGVWTGETPKCHCKLW